MVRLKSSEHDEAVILCQWMDLRGITYFHVPNEGKRRPSLAAKLRREGLKPGVPDYVILSDVQTVFLELKAENGRVTVEQRQWVDWLEANEYKVRICWGADDAIAWLKSLGY